MSRLNFEITLYHTPFIDNLISELNSIIEQKRKIYKRVRSDHDYHQKLSYEEREILRHLTSEEEKILLQLVELKGWTVNTNSHSKTKLRQNDNLMN